MSTNRLLALGIATLAALGFSGAALAQSRGTTTTGMFGSQTLGSPNGASPSAMGTGMTTGMGSNNSTGLGGGATQGTAFGSGLVGGMQNLQAGGATGFVGSSTANITNNLSRIGTPGGSQVARPTNFNQLTQLMTQSRQNQFNQQQAQRATRATNQPQGQFRVPLRLGFLPTPVSATRFNPVVSARITKVPGLAKIGTIEANLQGRTAVLRGTVATESDRQLAEALVRLEPEVLAVDNRLVVGSPEAIPPGPTSSR
jgi:hypothetical protein